MMNDPIADMLTRIRNAGMIKKSSVLVPWSKLKFSLAKLLEREGYIQKVEKVQHNNFSTLRIELKFNAENRMTISRMKRISKPGSRVYMQASALPHVLNDYGIAIVSTSQGIMTNKEARKRRLGGEILCEIY
ncbi:MAG: 30S ribosomal protein S8 [Candidatus Kerfeldbacteria bacterium RIFCSPHIGHO2_02_FULL_42_14]|uniref:Small ribosomal subunit protein uS8 n=1 Tax=Candidatus Kerfeldbacteria bacterium RIFCSPHIGHO2_02_FULL_42_14 TaxID=1798540 RepID=A0A1G2ART0_9BACT|nr:MAG: 30S ribosomal protein S8 [Candidatus Kerfeldbacteria bacterium RIFCSPHIGHO2_02_FULL_42_14]OGY80414.1 MAG: 30S ribosomal protein S8 [Candidatus Kerfeldbacteria bacterium RIFCSPHIGHO2_12_FULL_42_13]OGY83844.1 MAG: 30S ribosomal protein S8 [Candidatus Kerfeldbacteria bacterium RIFCSPLOWO2_02_FULL_42_19]OGY85311.1 MAG: 30S ribosomal protein S8 [Candidatus Kerfeldbacteria bacterium RIFCSPLOWO2_12_FULL_43_9]